MTNKQDKSEDQKSENSSSDSQDSDIDWNAAKTSHDDGFFKGAEEIDKKK